MINIMFIFAFVLIIFQFIIFLKGDWRDPMDNKFSTVFQELYGISASLKLSPIP
jgi:hypothetical protein